MSHAAYAAVELELPELLLDGPRMCAELAARTGSDERALHQLLRALASLELLRQHDGGRFELTPLGRLLASGAPASLRAWTRAWAGHHVPLWQRLADSVRTGRSARALRGEADGFAHLEEDPEQAISEAERRLPDGVRRRCELVAGDFFARVPPGADVYLMKSVLHDWDDERARAILARCRAACAGDARLVLVERVMPERLEPTPEHRAIAQSDLNMLVALGACERTAAEFDALLAAAGFARTRLAPAGPLFHVIEAAPV